MTDRRTVDTINDDQLSQLYDDLARAEEECRRYAEADSADAAAGSYAGRAETAEATVERVRAECDRLDAAVHANPTSSDFDGAYLAAIRHIRTALIHNDYAIAEPARWLHILFTSPDPTTANTSALAIRDHLAAEFPGVGMRISSNAVEAGSPPICELPHQTIAEEDVCEQGRVAGVAPELTAEEARDLVDELGTELYKAQDALAFVEECCVIADREQRAITTRDVRKWLKGAQCGRQLAADDGLVIDPAAPPLEFVTWAGPVVPRFTYRPVTPEMERAATERARQCAEQGERTAAWFARTGGVIGAPSCSPGVEETEPNNLAAAEATGLRTRVTALFEQWVKAGPPPLGVPTARWWDRRLVELGAAIHGAGEQSARTTAKNPPTSEEQQP